MDEVTGRRKVNTVKEREQEKGKREKAKERINITQRLIPFKITGLGDGEACLHGEGI